MTTQDGGPAFPHARPSMNQQGMSLREHFAGLAMNAEIISQGLEGRDIDHIAAMAYEMADAMLRAREER